VSSVSSAWLLQLTQAQANKERPRLPNKTFRRPVIVFSAFSVASHRRTGSRARGAPRAPDEEGAGADGHAGGPATRLASLSRTSQVCRPVVTHPTANDPTTSPNSLVSRGWRASCQLTSNRSVRESHAWRNSFHLGRGLTTEIRSIISPTVCDSFEHSPRPLSA
jgi:hypothetical protein